MSKKKISVLNGMKMVIDDAVIMNGKLNRCMRILISWDVCVLLGKWFSMSQRNTRNHMHSHAPWCSVTSQKPSFEEHQISRGIQGCGALWIM